jgi:hypothetical protein
MLENTYRNQDGCYNCKHSIWAFFFTSRLCCRHETHEHKCDWERSRLVSDAGICDEWKERG